MTQHIKHMSYIYITKRHRPIIQTNTPLAHARGGGHICAPTSCVVINAKAKLLPLAVVIIPFSDKMETRTRTTTTHRPPTATTAPEEGEAARKGEGK